MHISRPHRWIVATLMLNDIPGVVGATNRTPLSTRWEIRGSKSIPDPGLPWTATTVGRSVSPGWVSITDTSSLINCPLFFVLFSVTVILWCQFVCASVSNDLARKLLIVAFVHACTFPLFLNTFTAAELSALDFLNVDIPILIIKSFQQFTKDWSQAVT